MIIKIKNRHTIYSPDFDVAANHLEQVGQYLKFQVLSFTTAHNVTDGLVRRISR